MSGPAGPARGPLVAFLGPSLPAARARAIVPEVVLLPPVCQGDLSGVLEHLSPRAILIVDGEFGQSLSVWHKEVLAAIEAGTRVLGASSMGALRAAELDRYGMEGVGEIYAHFREGWLTEDADVALLYGDADAGWRPLTWPLVNVRATVAALARAGDVTPHEGDLVVAAAHQVHFSERTAPRLAAALREHGVEPSAADRLAASVRAGYVDQKALDAVAGFERLATVDDIPPPAHEDPLHRDGRGFNPLLWSDITLPEQPVPLRRYQLVNDVALHEADYEALLERALDRVLVVQFAAEMGVVLRDEQVAEERSRTLARLAIDEGGLPAWLAANHLDGAAFEGLMRDQATVRRMRRWTLDLRMYERNRRLVIEQLQLEGRYVDAVAGASRRRSLADSRPVPAYPTTMAHIADLALRQQARAPWQPSTTLVTWADEQGFDSLGGLVVALCDADAAGEALAQRRARVARMLGLADPAMAPGGAGGGLGAPRSAAAAASPTAAVAAPPRRVLRPGDAGRAHALLEAHQVTQVLLASVELRVPEHLLAGPASTAGLAEVTGTRADRLERLLEALRATGMVAVDADGRWSLTRDGRALAPADLEGAGSGGEGLDAYARDLRTHAMAAWAGLADVVRGAAPPAYPEHEVADAAIAAATTALGLARSVLAAIDPAPGARVLDLGGGLGGLAEALVSARPDLDVTLAELPGTAERARRRLAHRARAVTVVTTDEVGVSTPPVDHCLLARVLVTLDDDAALALLDVARRSLRPTGRIDVVDLQADGSPAATFGDLLNLARSGGAVRSATAWHALVARAGLTLVSTTSLRPPFVHLVLADAGATARPAVPVRDEPERRGRDGPDPPLESGPTPGPAPAGRPRTARDALDRFDEAFLGPEPEPEPAPEPASFAARALGDAPSPLEHIDRLFHLTSRRLWAGVLGMALVVGAGVVWSTFTDRIVTTQGQAVLLPPEGVFTVAATQTGQVDVGDVAVGDTVAAGQVLATITTPGQGAAEVTSPIDGVVVVVDVRQGEVAAAGSALFVVAPADSDVVALGLFPAGQVSALAVGQDASVTVNGVSPDRYGRVKGAVRSIGEVPVTPRRLLQLTGQESLAAALAQQGPLYEVVVGLEPDDTDSGVAWTRGRGPAQPIPLGALGLVSVVVDREPLIAGAFR